MLVPITLAVMLSFVLSPLTNLLRRLGLWRVPSVVLSILLALAVIGALGTLIGSQAAGLAEDAPRYAEAIEQKVEGVQAFATSRLGFLLRAFGAPGETAPAPPCPGAAAGQGPDPGGAPAAAGAGAGRARPSAERRR